MARLWTDGAENADISRVYACAASFGVVPVTSAVRTGSWAYRCGNGSADQSSYIVPTVFTSGISEMYMRWAFYQGSFTDGYHLLSWYNGATVIGSLRINTWAGGIMSFKMYDATTSRVTSSNVVIGIHQWHVLEVRVKIAGADSGIFTLKYDGTQIADVTAVTNTNGSTIDRVYIWAGQAVNNGGTWWDDIAINDTTTANDNGWIGDGGVLAALVPMTGTAAYSDLIASTGNAWECVNEIPASATDYEYESTIDKKSTHIMTNLSGLPSGASIARIWLEIHALESSAAGGKIATLLRSGSTDSQGPDITLTLAQTLYLSSEYLTDPADSSPWDSTKVNALEAGVVVR